MYICPSTVIFLRHVHQVDSWGHRIFDGVKDETRKSKASFEILLSYARLAEHYA